MIDFALFAAAICALASFLFAVVSCVALLLGNRNRHAATPLRSVDEAIIRMLVAAEVRKALQARGETLP